MARFEVYRLEDGGLVIDCQADFLDDIGTRFVVPLLPRGTGPTPNGRLNPVFEVNGEPLVMTTQFATAMRTQLLKGRVTSLEREHIRIIGAIDVLTGTG